MEMGKVENKNQFKFNPADYDYLDNLPLEGWIWEIIRRSESYRHEYEEIEKAVRNSSGEVYKVIGHFYSEFKHVNVRSQLSEEPNEDYFLKIKKGVYIPKPQAKYVDVDKVIHIKGTVSVEVASYKEYIEDEYMKRRRMVNESDYVFGEVVFDEYEIDPAIFLVNDLAVSTPEDTIYVGISRKAKSKDIEKHLLSILKEYLEPYKPKIRNDKWKYYLIVNDLKEKYQNKIRYKDISVLLMQAYPYIKITKFKEGKKIQKKIESSDYFSEKNCENFYKTALALIKGYYKKYLYL